MFNARKTIAYGDQSSSLTTNQDKSETSGLSHKTPQPSSSSKLSSDLPCYAQKPPIQYQQQSSESLIIDSGPSTEGGCKALADESDATSPEVLKASIQSSSKKSPSGQNKVSVSVHLIDDHS